MTALQPDLAHEEWGPGVADPAAWWFRLGVEGIGDLPRLPVPPEPAYRATLREFGFTLHRRMPQLLGRLRELEQIAAFATGSEGYRWLVAGAFTGKTALLYEAVTVGLPAGVDVVCYFLSRRASDATSDLFLAAVIPQLAYLCGVDPPVANVDQYHALWQQAAARAAQTGRHLLLIVDGLDEDLLPPGSPSVVSLLPALVNAHAHVLVASRPRPGSLDLVPDGHPLKTTQATDLSPFKGAQKLVGLARKEIDDLTHGDDADLAVEVLGVLTAAAGPLSLRDLAALRPDGQGAPSPADTRHVRRLVEDRAARSLERTGPAGEERYQFAHGSLLAYAQADDDLKDPEYRRRIHRWAAHWRAAGWPPAGDGGTGTPRYLLDTYPSVLTSEPQRLAELVCHVGWIEAAVQVAGVDRVLADLLRAAAADPASKPVAAMLATVTGQVHYLRPPRPVNQPGYVLRQLCLQALELSEDQLADELRRRLQALPGPCLLPQSTTRRASPALTAELGRHDGRVTAVAVLPSGQIVTGEFASPITSSITDEDGAQVLLWNPATPGAAPTELGRIRWGVMTMAALPGGQVVTGGHDRRVLVWDPATPGAAPAELGRHEDDVQEMAVLPGGQVVTGGMQSLPDGNEGRVLVWDPVTPGAAPAELGRHEDDVQEMAVLPGGQVVTGGMDGGRVLLWNPAMPGAGPAELGRHDGWVNSVAVLSSGQVVTGGTDWRVLVWDRPIVGTDAIELGCSVTALTAAPLGPSTFCLVVAHQGTGFSIWSIA